jgi:hypothetical protein
LIVSDADDLPLHKLENKKSTTFSNHDSASRVIEFELGAVTSDKIPGGHNLHVE